MSGKTVVAGMHTIVCLDKDPTVKDFECAFTLTKAADMAGTLAKYCWTYAMDLVDKTFLLESEVIDKDHPRLPYIILQFYVDFARAFTYPNVLPEAEVCIKLKQEIIRLFEKQNAQALPSDSVNFKGGQLGFLALSFNEADEKFYFPTYEKLLGHPWLVTESEVLAEIQTRLETRHAAEQK
jgi:hypothetical protein